jgi:hypothetical protein
MNHDALGQESIDFKSDSINLCLDATLDDETIKYHYEARDLTDDMLL